MDTFFHQKDLDLGPQMEPKTILKRSFFTAWFRECFWRTLEWFWDVFLQCFSGGPTLTMIWFLMIESHLGVFFPRSPFGPAKVAKVNQKTTLKCSKILPKTAPKTRCFSTLFVCRFSSLLGKIWGPKTTPKIIKKLVCFDFERIC